MKKLIILSVLFVTSSFATPPNGEKMAACPDKPNCVQSLSEKEDKHFIAPMPADSNILDQVEVYIKSQSGWSLETREGDYIHATFTSSILKFIDDVEFTWKDGMLHFRSASRKGYYDFGANCARIEDVKKALQ